jgi:hypothetical protein
VIISYFLKSFFIIITERRGGPPRCSLKVDYDMIRTKKKQSDSDSDVKCTTV